MKLEASDNSLTLVDVANEKTIPILVPHSDASGFQSMVGLTLVKKFTRLKCSFVQKVNIDVDYTTSSQPLIARISRFTRTIVTSLPVAVNVQDFFRGRR